MMTDRDTIANSEIETNLARGRPNAAAAATEAGDAS